MGQTDTRARVAILGTGTLIATSVLADAPAVGQAPAPEPDPAPAVVAATPVAGAKAVASVVVTKVRRHIMAGQRIVVRGRLRPAGAGNALSLQVRDGRRWLTVDHDRPGAAGRYRLAWRPAATGTKRVRVRFAGTRSMGPARRTAGSANVYRRALASWYGPGLYGAHLACGGTLSTSTLGV